MTGARIFTAMFFGLASAPAIICAAPLSLSQAIALARAHHPDVIESDALRASATAQAGVALAGYLPKLDLAVLGRYDYSNFTPVVAGTPSDTAPVDPAYPFASSARYAASLTLTQLLFDGGATVARISATRAQAQAAAANLATRRLAIEGLVVAAYFHVLEGNALVEVSEEYEARTAELVRSVRVLVKGGVRPEMDALSAEIRHQRATLDRIRWKDSLAQRRAQLISAMGLERDDDDLLQESLVQTIAEERETLTAITSRAFDRRPEVVSLRALAKAARGRIIAARSDFLPSVSLGLSGLMAGTNDVPGPLYSLFGYLSLEHKLFSGLATYRGLQQAQAERDASEARLLSLRSQLRAAIATTFSSVQAARESAAVAKVLVEQADRALASAQRRYDTGLLSFLELIDLHNQRVIARTADVQARYALYVARADLLRLVGSSLEGHAALQETSR